MSWLVIINLGSGSLQEGCSDITAQISSEESDGYRGKSRGSLPPASELAQLYGDWQLLYREFYRELGSRSVRTIEVESGGITHFSSVELGDFARQLKIQLNAWLDSESFHPIDRKLSRELDPNEQIRLVLETNDELLRRLPWHLWNFFEDYPQAELALSAPEYGRVERRSRTSNQQVRILAIFGNSDDLDLQVDRSLLEALPNAAPIFLESPTRRQLIEHLWHPRGWDILFFAGHSHTEGEIGTIQINQTESLTLKEFKNALKKAISCGLKLAIFNSCDGLGLGRDLADLHIPQTIVMREPVPDAIAQAFFRDFLAAFSSGQSLYVSVREARERLERLEDNYPCATWLPVICQNPAEKPFTWKDLYSPSPPKPDPPFQSWIKRFLTLLLTSIVITVSIMGLRYLGMFQPFELQAFDRLMQWRPAESQDERLLLVTIDEADIQYQNQQNMPLRWSLSDPALVRLLEKLEPLQPRTIGLDIYRDFATAPEYRDLAKRLQIDDRFFAVCKVAAPSDGSPDGTPPPPEVPPQRIGFSDFVADGGEIARRQLLHLTPPLTSDCAAEYAFSLQLALHYLNAEGIEATVTSEGTLKIGNALFERLQAHTSGYQGIDARGYQVLLNYRSLDSPQNIAQQVSLRDILTDKINPELVESLKHRLVLIGVTAQSTADYWQTPYSAWLPSNQKLIPGVFVQAQMVSQILSAVLDKRSLIWWWPLGAEIFWVWGWSLIGSILVWRFRQPLWLGIAGAVALVILSAICSWYFTRGGWLPLVPSVLALVTAQIAILLGMRSRSHNTKAP